MSRRPIRYVERLPDWFQAQRFLSQGGWAEIVVLLATLASGLIVATNRRAMYETVGLRIFAGQNPTNGLVATPFLVAALLGLCGLGWSRFRPQQLIGRWLRFGAMLLACFLWVWLGSVTILMAGLDRLSTPVFWVLVIAAMRAMLFVWLRSL